MCNSNYNINKILWNFVFNFIWITPLYKRKQGGICMLFKLIERAQKNDKLAMLEMIERFKPLLKKYAAKLKYEDAYDDILLYFIERIKNFNLEKQICRNDEAVASYMKVCIKNFCSFLNALVSAETTSHSA